MLPQTGTGPALPVPPERAQTLLNELLAGIGSLMGRIPWELLRWLVLEHPSLMWGELNLQPAQMGLSWAYVILWLPWAVWSEGARDGEQGFSLSLILCWSPSP